MQLDKFFLLLSPTPASLANRTEYCTIQVKASKRPQSSFGHHSTLAALVPFWPWTGWLSCRCLTLCQAASKGFFSSSSAVLLRSLSHARDRNPTWTGLRIQIGVDFVCQYNEKTQRSSSPKVRLDPGIPTMSSGLFLTLCSSFSCAGLTLRQVLCTLWS